ncbi:MAG: hypothetical protein KY462_02720 [Actinobacteria bacterium]|nr:hypothetical protein [Actinomycetota bacterium]
MIGVDGQRPTRAPVGWVRLVAVAVWVAAWVVAVPATPVAGCEADGYFVFEKITNVASELSWWDRDSCASAAATRTWRAGSGRSTDECKKGSGWLPDGVYDTRGQWQDFNGKVIDGRVIRLQDQQCYNRTWRTGLFIHSEEANATSDDCEGTGADRPYCWDGDVDYLSQGCIKLANDHGAVPAADDIGEADLYWRDRGGSPVEGPQTLPGKLHVRTRR